MIALLLCSKMVVGLLSFVGVIALMGIFAPWIAPHDPYANDILIKFAPYSLDHSLGTDHLGRDILSRLIYGIRPTLFLSLLTMLATISLGTIMGLLSGYFRGIVDEVIMRIVDMMLSFPSQIMIFAVIALLGVDVQNIIIANVIIKWDWYARMIRTNVMKYRDRNFILYSRCIGSKESYILGRHLLPSIASEMAVLASLDVGWTICFRSEGGSVVSHIILDVKNLHITFEQPKVSKQILEDVSFSVKAGKCLGILGESGSGKSMTTKAILGLLNRDFQISGTATFEGKDLLQMGDGDLRTLRGSAIGMILQNPMTCFNPLYKIGNQIYETFDAHGIFPRDQYKVEAINILEKMCIHDPEGVLQKFPHQLSGGMLQRVMIGIAMSMNPRLLICDEPTTAIDSITQYEIIKEFQRIKAESNVGMLFITHDVSVISHIADEVIVLNKGKLVDRGPFSEILKNPKDAYTKLLIEKKLAVADHYKSVLAQGGVR
ncbi:ATP-binding cassette domain-containing protein [uncultured Veillonella sp.]|uniref:ATP-binding cassette domain-containing protein n=1 Tax=uncultured Veillonella sp. TaxID=159268 RepID=UPI0028DBB9D3|nr:ATP-binding cassette domain-containing protein [uncultured Veillonella sp.]